MGWFLLLPFSIAFSTEHSWMMLTQLCTVKRIPTSLYYELALHCDLRNENEIRNRSSSEKYLQVCTTLQERYL